jgi:hypothetical protein
MISKHAMDDDVIYEPEFNILKAQCACGARFLCDGDLKLHQRETCPRRFDPNFKLPPPLPPWFGSSGDGGRKT